MFAVVKADSLGRPRALTSDVTTRHNLANTLHTLDGDYARLGKEMWARLVNREHPLVTKSTYTF